MLNAMSPVPKPNFEFSPYNLHKTKWLPNGEKTALTWDGSRENDP